VTGPRLTAADLHLAQRLYGGELTTTPAGLALVGAEMGGAVVDLGPVRS
jgi:hypothetical protein